MTKKLLYETYLKETGDIITLEEWILSESKIKKMTGYWDALKRYGFIGLASYLSGDKDIKDNASRGLLSVPLSLILYAGYKKTSDPCINKCDTPLCKQKCYLGSCGLVIKEIHGAIQDVKSKTRTLETRKALKKLDKQLIKWVQKFNKHKIKMKKIIEIEKKEAETNSVAGMARYFTKNQDEI
jgi:hypothetical protein